MKERNTPHSARHGNVLRGGPIAGLAADTLRKFDVHLANFKDDVLISNFEMVDYEEKNKTSVFGEKESIAYMLNFRIYNVEFQTKLLTFEYKTKSELLKLDIDCNTREVKKELKYCCNSLQRRRNLNLMFVTLISFARYLESRRLICDLILKRNQYIKIMENKDGGKIVIYVDLKKNIKLGIFWSVECNSEHDVFDKVEVYFKVSDKAELRDQLTHLTEPHLDFTGKYHAWKSLIKCLSNASPKSLKRNSTESDDDLTGISVMTNPQLLPNRNQIKMEVAEEEVDVVSLVSSSSPSHNDPNHLVCIKSPNVLSHSNNDLSVILLSDNEDLEDALDDNKSGTATSTSPQQSLRCDDIFSPKWRPGGLRRCPSIVEVDLVVPPKKPKIVDDDLEITGVTYVVPD